MAESSASSLSAGELDQRAVERLISEGLLSVGQYASLRGEAVH